MTSTAATTLESVGDVMPKTLFGYDVIDFIGQGAGSLIYAVSHPTTKQVYALKHVVRKSERDERFIEQLENEYQVGRIMNHPGLRRSIDLKINRTLLRKVTDAALVMELVDGLPLETHVPKTVAEIVAVFIQTAKALESLNSAGYVHCDLKPNNILVDAAGHVKVIDLGQAARTGTAKKRIQGTPDYIAPEQVKCLPVTVKTDVYNLGATLYWALCGRNLPTLFTLKKSENSFLVDDQMSSPREINPLVPETLSNLVMECVRINPAKRPQDMGELARRLEIIEHAIHKSMMPASSNGSGAGFRVGAAAHVG